MKKRIILLAVYMLLFFVLPGCWDYVEYEDLAQVLAVGIDYDSQTDETTVTIQYPSIKKGKGGSSEGAGDSETQWIAYAATDKTVFGAMTKLQEVVRHRLFYGYIKVLIVGEESAKRNMMDLIDLFDRTPVMRSSAYVVITSGKAEDVIKTLDPSRIPAGEKLQKLIRETKDTGTAYEVTLNDFLQMLAVGGWEATAPRAILITAQTETSEEKEGKNGKEAKGGTQGNIRSLEKRPGALRVAGMAAFQGDKFAGWLDEQESMGLCFIRGKNIHALKSSESAGSADIEELYFRILESSSKIKVRIENDQPVIYVKIKVVADLRKYYRNEGEDFLSPEALRVVEQKLSDSIRSDVDAALRKGQQELKTDIFGFGFALFRKDPKSWQNEYGSKWADIYPDVPVNVDIDVKVINTGIKIRKLFVK